MTCELRLTADRVKLLFYSVPPCSPASGLKLQCLNAAFDLALVQSI